MEEVALWWVLEISISHRNKMFLGNKKKKKIGQRNETTETKTIVW